MLPLLWKDAGHAHMGVGHASGKDKAEAAANAAVSSPLLETSIHGAHGVIISITSSDDIGLEDVEVASEIIAKEAHPDATIIWGVSFDDMLDDEMVVTVVATGFGEDGARGIPRRRHLQNRQRQNPHLKRRWKKAPPLWRRREKIQRRIALLLSCRQSRSGRQRHLQRTPMARMTTAILIF